MNYLLSTPKFKHIQKEIGEILLKYDISSEDKDKINEVIKTTMNYSEDKEDYATMYWRTKVKDKLEADVETKEAYLARKRESSKKWLSNPENLEKRRAYERERQRKLREQKKLEVNTKDQEKLDFSI